MNQRSKLIVLGLLSTQLIACSSISEVTEKIKQDYAEVSAEVDKNRYLSSLVTYKGSELLTPSWIELTYKPLAFLVAEEANLNKARSIDQQSTRTEGYLTLMVSDQNIIASAYGSNYEIVVKDSAGKVVLRERGDDDVPSVIGRSFVSFTTIGDRGLVGVYQVDVVSLFSGKVYPYEVRFGG